MVRSASGRIHSVEDAAWMTMANVSLNSENAGIEEGGAKSQVSRTAVRGRRLKERLA
jgi:hypothetical protein